VKASIDVFCRNRNPGWSQGASPPSRSSSTTSRRPLVIIARSVGSGPSRGSVAT
jgi:hypothetical protein